jgi:hypothetical protein
MNKNIYVLPTDKPSRLYRNLLTDKLFILENSVMDVSECNREYQHIYITNNEEIKEGIAEWGFDLYENKIFFPVNNWKGLTKGRYKKIILTTDQDLISDGVEQISEDTLLKIVEHINSGKNIESFDKL